MIRPCVEGVCTWCVPITGRTLKMVHWRRPFWSEWRLYPSLNYLYRRSSLEKVTRELKTLGWIYCTIPSAFGYYSRHFTRFFIYNDWICSLVNRHAINYTTRKDSRLHLHSTTKDGNGTTWFEGHLILHGRNGHVEFSRVQSKGPSSSHCKF